MNNYLKNGTISHKAFLQQVVELARFAGYELIYHTWDSRNSPAGYPDLMLLKDRILIVAELKIPPDNLSPEQYFWLLEFSDVPGVDVYVWWPEDWAEIKQVIYDRR